MSNNNKYIWYSRKFQSEIMKALPQKWVISFGAYEALEVFDIEDFIDMAPLEAIHKANIIKTCIKYLLPDKIFDKYYSSEDNPKSILEAMIGRYNRCEEDRKI